MKNILTSGIKSLARVINRSKDTIKEHLTELSNSKILIKFYEVSNHSKQAYYKSTKEGL